MPQITVGSANINTFGFSAVFNIQDRTVFFDTSVLTSYISGGINNVQGICLSLVDQDGVELMGVDWSNPQIVPATDETYTLDLSYLSYAFLFQNYKIIGYIKDANGTVYSTEPVYKKICQPVSINESGYVPGTFQIIPNCPNNTLTVKELTILAYNNLLPESVVKSGLLYYPTGTISPIAFTGTPFTNNVIYTGQYRITDTTDATYNLNDDIYVVVSYYTDSPFPVNCTTSIADLLCCVEEVQQTAIRECTNARGQAAKQKLLEISTYLSTGLLAEINGQDASFEADYIRKALNCNCGATSIHQNEATPVNPTIYSIIINGVGGTTVAAPTITGATKTFNVVSSTYIVSKKDAGDLAFTITVDTSVTNVVRYLIAFDYNKMADYILTEFEGSAEYTARLQALLVTGLNLSGLNGACILNTSTANYTIQLTGITASDLIESITINGIIHLAPANTHANNATAVQTWLNTLALGTFAVTFSAGVITISSLSNSHTLSTVVFEIGGVSGSRLSVLFQNSKYTLVQILQAIIDYLCGLTALQVALGNNLTLYQFDYNGNIVSFSYSATGTQDAYNTGVAAAIQNLILRIDTLTGITCAKLKAIFVDRPNGVFGTADRIYGTLGEECAGLTDLQFATAVFNAVGKYASVKELFCAIDCETPATCPDISDTSLAMSGANIGVYGLTWTTTPQAAQTVTVKYKLTSSSTWIVATNSLVILPNGNISGTTPFVIINPVAGQTYDVLLVNNCGGAGFQKQITVPTGTVYSGNYYRSNNLYTICGTTPLTLYSSAPFAAGIIMYSDIGLTTPVTGYTFITTNSSNIYGLNTSTGVVGTDTGSACSTGTAGSYILGNNTGTICNGTPQTLYTNGAFVVGGTLYNDSALTSPVTGYSYVVNGSTNVIYNLNSVTGAIGVSTGLSCSFAVGTLAVLGCVSTGHIASVSFNGNPITGLFPMISATSQTVNTTANGTHSLVVAATGTFGSIFVRDSFGNEYCQNYTAPGNYTFTGFIISPSGTNDFSVTMDCGAC